MKRIALPFSLLLLGGIGACRRPPEPPPLFAPTVSAGPPASVCPGQGAPIGATGTPGLTYAWSPTTALDDPARPQTVARPLETTRYTLTVADPATGFTNSASVLITVPPPTLDHLSLTAFPSTATAGALFTVEARAYDSCGNVLTTYAEAATVADASGLLAPLAGSFSAGIFAVTASVCRTSPSDRLVLTAAGGGVTSSPSFAVGAGPAARLVVDPIPSPQATGAPFLLSARAEDACGNPAPSFAAGAIVIDGTGSLTFVTAPLPFAAGVLTEEVLLCRGAPSDVVTVLAGGLAGASNDFAVDEPPATLVAGGFPVTVLSGLPASVTAYALNGCGQPIGSYASSATFYDSSSLLLGPVSAAPSSGTFAASVTLCGATASDRLFVVSGGLSTQTSPFSLVQTLDHVALGSFPNPVSEGTAYPFGATAFDACGLVDTGFSGSAALTSSASTPSTSAPSFAAGYVTAALSLCGPSASETLTLSSGGKSATTPVFSVHLALPNRLVLGAVAAGQIAGLAFTVTAAAYDACDNLAANFSAPATYADTAGTLPVQTGSFASGLFSTPVTLCTPSGSDRIVVATGGLSTQTSPFSVVQTLDHVALGSFPNPVSEGVSYPFGATAYDACGNVDTGFSGPAALTSSAATPSTTAPIFTGGYVTTTLSLCGPSASETLTLSSGGKSATTPAFMVNLGTLAGLALSPVSAVAAGEPFPVTAYALDACSTLLTTYSAAATFGVLSGGALSPVTGSLTAGLLPTTYLTLCQGVPSTNRLGLFSGGDTALTGTFTVGAGPFRQMTVGAIPSPQAAGTPFTVAAQSEDSCGNLVSTYGGSATASDETATIAFTPASFSSGVLSLSASVCATVPADFVTLYSGGVTGATPAPFAVTSGPLDHLAFATLPDPVQTGVPFPVTLYAEDVCGNVSTQTSATASLSDGTGTLLPTSLSVTSGIGTAADFSLCTPAAVDTLTARLPGASAVSPTFAVTTGPAAILIFGAVASPQAVGRAFTLSARALDGCGKNLATTFGAAATLTDASGTVSPASGAFAGGLFSLPVTIGSVTFGDQVTLYAGGLVVTSSPFAVITPGVFSVQVTSAPSRVTEGTSFTIWITVLDQLGNPVTYSGTASLTDQTGTLSPSVSSAFANTATLSQSVSLCGLPATDWVTVTVEGIPGASGAFTVSSGPMASLSAGAITGPQTVCTPFSVGALALDSCGNTATGYSGAAMLSDPFGTLAPVASSFSSGVLSQPVTVSAAAAVWSVSVTSGGQTSTAPVSIAVTAPLDRLVLGPFPASVSDGTQFGLTARALDACGSLLSGYAGGAALTDASGTIAPSSGSFSGGLLSLIAEACANATLSDTVTLGSGGKVTQSVPFGVTRFADAGPPAFVYTGGSVALGTPALPWVVSYLWDPLGMVSPATAAQTLASPTRTTVFTIYATAPTTGCVDSATTYVDVYLYVLFTIPPDGSPGYPLNASQVVAFSEPMDASTLTPAAFLYSDGVGGGPVANPSCPTDTVGYNAGTESALTYNGCLTGAIPYPYLVTVAGGTSGVRSLLGNFLQADFNFGFSTVTASVQSPWVVTSAPCAVTNVAANTEVWAQFSTDMDPRTIAPATLSLTGPTGTVTAAVAYDLSLQTGYLSPATNLAPYSTYTLRVSGARDLAENLVTAYACSFQTGVTVTTHPFVTTTYPSAGATGAPPAAVVTATFSAPMNALTINPSTFLVRDALGNTVLGTVGYSNGTTTATFTPAVSFNSGATYTVTLTAGMTDLNGNALSPAPYVWRFTTGGYLLNDPVPNPDPLWVPTGGWSVTGSRFHSAPASWVDNYTKGVNDTLALPATSPVSLASVTQSATLTFWTTYNFFAGRGGDHGIVQICNDDTGCSSWTNLLTLSGKNTAWSQQKVSVPSSFLGHNVLLRFLLKATANSKASGAGNYYWYLDDFQLSGQ